MAAIDEEKVINAWEPCCSCGDPAAAIAEVGRQLAVYLDKAAAIQQPGALDDTRAFGLVDAATMVREWCGVQQNDN